MIDRQKIIAALQKRLESNPAVFAMWLEGADAHDRVDLYSDIDIWLDVLDGNEDAIWAEIEQALAVLAPVDFMHENDHEHPKIRQKFFHLQGTLEYLIIDVCLQSHSRVFWYTKGYADEKVRVLFDKQNVIQYRDADPKKLEQELARRVSELRKTYSFFQAWTRKELYRANFLEAFSYYQKWILEPLVEVLRIKHQPTKRNFYLKHISLDLPSDVVSRLEDLYKISSLDDIEKKSKAANVFFEDAMKEMGQKSTITCPHCGFKKEEIMPTNACQYFYECSSCRTRISPKSGDCCVFCSYGSNKCPSKQVISK